MNNAPCYWFTGLSASGKTTYSRLFAEELRALGHEVVVLDGDELRLIFLSTSFSRSSRLNLGFQYFSLAKLIASQGVIVIVAAIGMFDELREWNRLNIKNYYEIFLDVPNDELIRRDPKGIYKKFLDGEISNLAGFDLVVEIPKDPDYHFIWKDEGSFNNIVPQLIAQFIFLKDGNKTNK